MKSLIVLLASSLSLTACGPSQAQISAEWTGKSAADQRALLDKLADNCRLPHDFYKLEGDQLTIRPRADEKNERVDCGLGALKGIRGMPKLGFVGNEYYVGNEQ